MKKKRSAQSLVDRGRICSAPCAGRETEGASHLLGSDILSCRRALTRGGSRPDSVVLTGGSRPNRCSSSPCEPHPHGNAALSHRAGWQRPLWLRSICRHAHSPFYRRLISRPPLHFSKLRRNFVSGFMPRPLLLFLTSPVTAVIQASPCGTEGQTKGTSAAHEGFLHVYRFAPCRRSSKRSHCVHTAYVPPAESESG